MTPGDEPEAPAPEAEEGLEAMRAKLDAAEQRALYLQAELENVRKAADRDRMESSKYAAAAVLEKLLAPLDELDAAVEALPEEHARGVAMIRDNLEKTLEEVGLQEIPAEALPFDPYRHEAVEVVRDTDAEEGTVARVLRKGYSYNLKVLRPALVAVVKRGEEDG